VVVLAAEVQIQQIITEQQPQGPQEHQAKEMPEDRALIQAHIQRAVVAEQARLVEMAVEQLVALAVTEALHL
jgi:hypothetical protein